MPINTGLAETHEEQLARLQAEVAALRDQLRRSQRLASLGTMAAMVAHEFNNIITPIINYAQMARSNPALTSKAIDRAADGGQRASSICKALLGIAREDSSPLQEIRLLDVVSETLAGMMPDPQTDQIDLVCRVPADLVLVTRRVELQQVLMNLLLNARAAVMAKQPPRLIEIVAEECGQIVVIGVRDNGIGIPPENLTRIFEPFFTTRRQQGQLGGSGLGLTIVRELVSSLGGRVSVQSEPGRGATFTVCLPSRPAG